MLSLVKPILIEALERAKRLTPQTKVHIKYMSILDVSPLELCDFMEANNIPQNAYFAGTDNGYDAFDDICLAWDIDIPTTDKDKEKFKRNCFNEFVKSAIFKILYSNGFKTRPYNSIEYKKLCESTLYDAYLKDDFDYIERYCLFTFYAKSEK